MVNANREGLHIKVLFVCLDDFPLTGACTSLLNNMFFQGGLANSVQELAVMTVKHHLNQKESETKNGIHVHRALVWNYISVNEIKAEMKKSPFRMATGLFCKLGQRVWDKLFRREFLNAGRVRTLRRKLEQIHAEKYDVIVAVAGDFHTVKAVSQFKKKHSFQFVIYQVDPCATNQSMDPRSIAARQKFEHCAYACSDAVITTDIICKELKKQNHGSLDPKFVAMEFPNVSCKEEPIAPKKGEKKSVTCIFTGSIYGGVRSPEYTIKLFEKMADPQIRMLFVGAMGNSMAQIPAPANVECLGVKSLQETKQLLANADVLINIGNIVLNQVPSKLFEYISTGKPIVNVCTSKNCPTIPYMEKYPLALNLFEEDDLEMQAEKMNQFIHENWNKQVPQKEILRLYKTCTPEYCAQQMLQIFQEISA